MNESYTLQLRHGAEAKNFSTRDEVFDYIKGQINYGGVQLLPYEPVLFFYGDDSAKNTAIVVGLPDGKTFNGNKYFIIDTAALKEQIEAVDKKYDEAVEELKDEDKKLWDAVNQEIADRIAADEAEAEARIAADEAEAETRANKDAELEQEIADETAARIAADEAEAETRANKDTELEGEINFTKDDLKSVIEACGFIYNDRLATDRVSYEPDSHDEIIRDAKSATEAIDKVSKFVAKVAKDLKISVEDTQTIEFTMTPNEKDGGNIISADVRIAGSEGLSKKNLDNNIIGQTSEGLYASATLEKSADKPNMLIFKKSGYINGQFVVDAYETEVPLFVYDGDSGNETGITIGVDSDKNKIKAQLNLSSKESNILKLEDGEYTVDGLAKNIKYKDTTVFNALNKQENEIEEIKDAVDFVKAIDMKGSETSSAIVSIDKTSKGDFTVRTDVKLSNDNSIIIANGGLKADVNASFNPNSCVLSFNVGNNRQSIDLSSLAVSAIEDAYYDAANENLVISFRVGEGIKKVVIPVATLIHDVDVEDTTTIDLTLKTALGGKDVISGQVKIDNTSSDNILNTGRNGLYVSREHITNAVNAESNARMQADESLAADIREAMTSINANKIAITAEETRAKAAEVANTNAINNEIARATEKETDIIAKVTENKSAIDNEVIRAKGEEVALKNAIDTNKSAIASEESRAKAAEVENANAIAAEVSRATTAEANIAKEVNSEAVRAQAAESALNESIENCQDKVNDNAVAIRAEETRAKEAETALDSKIADAVNAVNAEVARAQAAEQTNANAIVGEKNRAEEKESDLLAKIGENSSKIAENKAAVSAEATRAQSAEEALKGSIDTNKMAIATEEARAKAAEAKNAADIAAEVNRATEKENDLAEKVADNSSKIDDNAKAIAAETSRAIAAENANSAKADAAKSAVETEIARAKAAEAANTTAIDTEKSRAQAAEAELLSKTNQNTQAIAALKTDTEQVKLDLATETTRAKAAESANSVAISTEATRAKVAEEELSTKVEKNVADVAEIKDTVGLVVSDLASEVVRAKAAEEANASIISNEIARAKTAEGEISTKANQNAQDIVTTKTIADKAASELAEEIVRAKAAEEANVIAIATEKSRAELAESNLNTAVVKNASDIATLSTEIGNIELRKEGELAYALYVNGTKHGEFNIPKDQFLKSVSYDSTTKELVFVFNTTVGEVTTKVSIADLVNIYNAGNGLSLNGNTFSVDLGVVASVVYVNSSINAEVARAKAAEEANAVSISTEVNRAKLAEGELSAKVEKNISDIAVAKAKAELAVADLANEVVRAKAAEESNATSIVNEKNRALTAESEISSKVEKNISDIADVKTVANQNKLDLATEITRAKAAEASNATAVTNEVNRATIAEEELSGKITAQKVYIDSFKESSENALKETKTELSNDIAKKANSVDVYTKEEILERLGGYAQTSDVQSKLDEKLNVTDAQNTYATKDALQVVKDSYATLQHVDNADTQLSERISNSEDELDNINLSYNEATSELIYTNKNGVSTTYKLYGGSLIKKGEFDPLSNSIVLTIENVGIESQITIPVSQLLSDLADKIQANTEDIQKINTALSKLAKDWKVENTSTVSLVKSTVGEQDVLSANVLLSSSNKQAIQSTGSGLYVSNDLEDFTCVFGAEGAISGQDAISKLLDETKSIRSDFGNRITNVENEMTRLTQQVSDNTESISTIKSDLAEVKVDVKSTQSEVENLKVKVTEFEGRINTIESNIATMSSDLEKVKDIVKDIPEGGFAELVSEIHNIWEVIYKLVDAGEYN